MPQLAQSRHEARKCEQKGCFGWNQPFNYEPRAAQPAGPKPVARNPLPVSSVRGSAAGAGPPPLARGRQPGHAVAVSSAREGSRNARVSDTQTPSGPLPAKRATAARRNASPLARGRRCRARHGDCGRKHSRSDCPGATRRAVRAPGLTRGNPPPLPLPASAQPPPPARAWLPGGYTRGAERRSGCPPRGQAARPAPPAGLSHGVAPCERLDGAADRGHGTEGEVVRTAAAPTVRAATERIDQGLCPQCGCRAPEGSWRGRRYTNLPTRRLATTRARGSGGAETPAHN